MGADRAEAERWVAAMDAGEPPQSAECDVYAENWDTVMLFLRVQTQWRTSGLGYPAVESVMRMCRVKDRGAMLDRLRVMEAAALEAMSEETNAGQ
jgi:hypothetical protein